MSPKKAVRKKTTPKKKITTNTMSLPVLGVNGKKKGTVRVPKALFDTKVNTQVLAQAVRVYQTNQRVWPAVVKTRGQVQGSTRKIYRQKGTGRARHGGIRAPIFVGGGVAMGPTKRNKRMKLTKKQRTIALESALTTKLSENKLFVVDGLEDVKPKTKQFVSVFDALGLSRRILVFYKKGAQNVKRGTQNIQDVHATTVESLSAYKLILYQNVLFSKPALQALLDIYTEKTS